MDSFEVDNVFFKALKGWFIARFIGFFIKFIFEFKLINENGFRIHIYILPNRMLHFCKSYNL